MGTSIHTSQLSAITSPGTYNGRSDLTSEGGHIAIQKQSGESIFEAAKLRLHFLQLSGVHLSQFACTPTALATSKKPTCGAVVQLLIPDSLLERRIPTDKDLSTNEALSRQEGLPKRRSPTEQTPND
jgi:hypothetical protein